MTSNLGSSMILEHRATPDKLPELLNAELRQHFRPEFLNRIDETLIFHALGQAQIRQIVKLQLDRMAQLLQQQNIALKVTDAASDLIAEAGYDPDFGARPLKRAIIRLVETPVSREIIAGQIRPDTTLTVDCVDHQLTFSDK